MKSKVEGGSYGSWNELMVGWDGCACVVSGLAAAGLLGVCMCACVQACWVVHVFGGCGPGPCAALCTVEEPTN
jgi:hypothetical protein